MELLRGLEGRVRNPIDADELGGHALSHLGIVMGLPKDRQSGVGMQVDEARAHYIACRIYGPCRLEAGVFATVQRDLFVLDEHGRIKPRTTAAVDYQAVDDLQVCHGFILLPGTS